MNYKEIEKLKAIHNSLLTADPLKADRVIGDIRRQVEKLIIMAEEISASSPPVKCKVTDAEINEIWDKCCTINGNDVYHHVMEKEEFKSAIAILLSRLSSPLNTNVDPVRQPIIEFNILPMENNISASDGKAILMLSSRDYKAYVNSMQSLSAKEKGAQDNG